MCGVYVGGQNKENDVCVVPGQRFCYKSLPKHQSIIMLKKAYICQKDLTNVIESWYLFYS